MAEILDDKLIRLIDCKASVWQAVALLSGVSAVCGSAVVIKLTLQFLF